MAGTNSQNPQASSGRFPVGIWDIFTGLPAGTVIFMGTVLSNALIHADGLARELSTLLMLGLIAFGVGVLSGIVRLRHGPATAFFASLTTDAIIGYLWLSYQLAPGMNFLVIGPVGMSITLLACVPGALVGKKIRKS